MHSFFCDGANNPLFQEKGALGMGGLFRPCPFRPTQSLIPCVLPNNPRRKFKVTYGPLPSVDSFPSSSLRQATRHTLWPGREKDQSLIKLQCKRKS